MYDEEEDSVDDNGSYESRNDNPISISFRNNILDHCNDQYEQNVIKNTRPSPTPTVRVSDQNYMKSSPLNGNKGYQPSPYR